MDWREWTEAMIEVCFVRQDFGHIVNRPTLGRVAPTAHRGATGSGERAVASTLHSRQVPCATMLELLFSVVVGLSLPIINEEAPPKNCHERMAVCHQTGCARPACPQREVEWIIP